MHELYCHRYIIHYYEIMVVFSTYLFKKVLGCLILTFLQGSLETEFEDHLIIKLHCIDFLEAFRFFSVGTPNNQISPVGLYSIPSEYLPYL